MKLEDWMAFQKDLIKIDTHEHIPPELYAMSREIDIFDVLLIPYNCDTMFSAGCTAAEWAQIMDKKSSFSHRYVIFEKFLPLIQHTAFFRAAKRSLALNYQESELTQAALERANIALKQELSENHYHSYMQKYKIESIFCCTGYDQFEEYTDPAVRFIPTVSEILPRNQQDLQRFEAASKRSVYDLHSFLSALDALFEKYQSKQVTAIKFGSGYRRKLDFSLPDFTAADIQLSRILNFKRMGDEKYRDSLEPCCSYEELCALDDYLTNYMLILCKKHSFSAIFHTAMHAWNENAPERAHAQHLTYCIQQHRAVNFILLHAGAPFFEEAVLLARYYPNVYLDLTWFHIISPELAKKAITRILELLPTNKVFAFGGDYCAIQTLAGHLEMAMQNFSEVFVTAVAEGVLTQESGKAILRAWYYENPKRVLGV